MKLSFPYMGCVTGYKKIFEAFGHEIIMPNKPTQRTFDLGVKYSPEFMCYPFKVITGTLIEACENGAEIIISSGGTGPCRAGYYGEIHKRILKSLGYDTEIIIFDAMFEDFGEFMRKLFLVANKTNIFSIAKSFAFAMRLINQMDNFQKDVNIVRAYEINQGETSKVWDRIVNLHDKCTSVKELKALKAKCRDMLDEIPVRLVENKDRIRIGIVGEIYVIMESSTNADIERRLNELGCEVYNIQYISDWIKHNTMYRFLHKVRSREVLDKSNKYTKVNCGGHDKENMGWIVDFAEQGFDAVIHLMPFSCLPELVSRSIIPEMSNDLNMPILSVSLDEQTGSANIQTRLEAFIDLVKNKKTEKSETYVSGHDGNITDVKSRMDFDVAHAIETVQNAVVPREQAVASRD